MYLDLLKRVAEEQLRFGSTPQPPCTPQQLQMVVTRARQELHCALPQEYLDFLEVTNGFDWNGVVIYACERTPIAAHPDRFIDGIIESNQGFRDDSRFSDLLVLGTNGMDLYTQRLSTKAYEIYDEVPHELVGTPATFAELMTSVLTRSLQ
jgi:hypothetical protein